MGARRARRERARRGGPRLAARLQEATREARLDAAAAAAYPRVWLASAKKNASSSRKKREGSKGDERQVGGRGASLSRPGFDLSRRRLRGVLEELPRSKETS